MIAGRKSQFQDDNGNYTTPQNPPFGEEQRTFRINAPYGKFSNKKSLLKIGIAHSSQKINKVPINNYDKKLDVIITEKYVLR